MRIGIILTADERSKAYLQKIIKNKILINEIIFMNQKNVEKKFSEECIEESKKCGFNISESVEQTLKKNKMTFKEFKFNDINNHELIEFIKKSNTEYFIFTGGGILKDEILSCRSKFIHFHPGIVPEYRGSTCFYYSIINQGYCGVTAFIMNKGLDTGDIIYQKKFLKPSHQFIDDVYDANIRSETLIDILKNNYLEKNQTTKQDKIEGNTYFIIHPVLKHIAILKSLN